MIGSRCDPYTNAMLRGTEINHCCHSNLTRALTSRGVPKAESLVHDVLNVFMCTGMPHLTRTDFIFKCSYLAGHLIGFSRCI